MPGTLAWQVEQLRGGKSLLTDDASESMRRACTRAISKVTDQEPQRAYDLSLWYAVHRTGEGEPLKLLKIKRLA